jgi:hypothetical protein
MFLNNKGEMKNALQFYVKLQVGRYTAYKSILAHDLGIRSNRYLTFINRNIIQFLFLKVFITLSTKPADN